MAFQADSFISDEEEEVCPLCVEEMDISDRNFKPCPCGYQICQFCYNNIRQNPQLNGRCPGCRRPYDDESIQYKVISPEEWKNHHVKQTKQERERKQKEREKKEMEQSSRKHLSGMRVIQKNLVYVIGLNPDIPTEDLHNTLRGEQFFGQYGRIQKIVINRRNNVNGTPGLGVYVTFAKKEDAARCISAVDGSMNDGKYLRAAYGTTKYCSSYLRGQPCPNPNCMFLHEPGEEADSYTRQDLSTIQHAARQGIQKQQRQQQQQQRYGDFQSSPVQPSTPLKHQSGHAAVAQHATEDIHGNALPASASWAKQSPTTPAGKLHTPVQASPVKPTPVEPAVHYPMPDPDAKRQTDFTLPLFKNTLKSLSKNKFDFVFSSAIIKSLDLDDDKSTMPSLFAFSKANILDPAKHESAEFSEGQFTPFAVFSGGKAAALPLASDETQSFQQLMKGGPSDRIPDQAATPPPGLMGDSSQKQHHSLELLAHLMNGGKKDTSTTLQPSQNVKSVLAAGYEDSSLRLTSPPKLDSNLPKFGKGRGDPSLAFDDRTSFLHEPPTGPPPGLGTSSVLPPPGLNGPRPETAMYDSLLSVELSTSPLETSRPEPVRPEPFHPLAPNYNPGIAIGYRDVYEANDDPIITDDDEPFNEGGECAYHEPVKPPTDWDIESYADDAQSTASGIASEMDPGSRPATPDLDLGDAPRILSSEHISVLSKNEKRKYRNSLKAYEREKKQAIKNYKKKQDDATRATSIAKTIAEEDMGSAVAEQGLVEAQAKQAMAEKAYNEMQSRAVAEAKAVEAKEEEERLRLLAAEEQAKAEKQRAKEEKLRAKEEKAKLKAEKAVKLKAEKEKKESERLERLRKQQAEKEAADLQQKERLEREKAEKEKAEKEKAEKERYERSLLAMKKEKAERAEREAENEKAEKENSKRERQDKSQKVKKERAEREKLELAERDNSEQRTSRIVAPQPKKMSQATLATWDQDDGASDMSSLTQPKTSGSDDYQKFNSHNARRGASGQIGGHLADYLASPSPQPYSPSTGTPEPESTTPTKSKSSSYGIGDLLRDIVGEVDMERHPLFDVKSHQLFNNATVNVMVECQESVDVFEKQIKEQLVLEPDFPSTKEIAASDLRKFITDSSDNLLQLAGDVDEDVFIDDLDMQTSDSDSMGSLPEFASSLITKHAHLISPSWKEVVVEMDDLDGIDDTELPFRQNIAEEVFNLQNEMDKCIGRNQRLFFRHTGKQFGEEKS